MCRTAKHGIGHRYKHHQRKKSPLLLLIHDYIIIFVPKVFIPSIKTFRIYNLGITICPTLLRRGQQGQSGGFLFFSSSGCFLHINQDFFFSDRSEKVGGEIFVEKARGPLPFPIASIIIVSIIIAVLSFFSLPDCVCH